MVQHIVANITWQDNYWTGEPSQEDIERTGHRWVSEGNIGHEYLNFALERNVKDGFKYGFFQATRQPTRFSNGVGNVFFFSKGFIVGGPAFVSIRVQLRSKPDQFLVREPWR